MALTTNIINREAGDKAKDPRLQRLRCALLLLEAIEKYEKPHVYGAVEYQDDVYIGDGNTSLVYLEQNKNFSEDTSFTFNNPQILNTMVGFCDMWVEYIVKSKNVVLGFYATNAIGKESNATAVVTTGITLPDKPILELLQTHQLDYPNLLSSVKALTLHEYKSQYSGKRGKGNIDNLEAFSDEDWVKFLTAITWKFGADEEEETQKLVLEKITKCKFFCHNHVGHEESILRSILDLLDEKQCLEDLLSKFAHVSDIQLIFAKIGTITVEKSDDPVYKIWNSIDPPLDKRSITDKITAVCNSIDPNKIKTYARKTAGSRILQDEKVSDKSFSSLRYRVYEKCAEELEAYLTNATVSISTQMDVDTLFQHLYAKAKEHVTSMSADFSYSLKSEPVIEGIVLELFDSCYLALN